MRDDILEDDGKPVDYEIVAEEIGNSGRMLLLARCPFCRQLVGTDSIPVVVPTVDGRGTPTRAHGVMFVRPARDHLIACALDNGAKNKPE